jgi:hypothetical protein
MDVNSSHGRRAVLKSISGSVIAGGLASVNTVNAEESNAGFSADIMVDSYSSTTENYTIEVADRITRDVLFSTSVEVSPGSHKEYEKVFPEKYEGQSYSLIAYSDDETVEIETVTAVAKYNLYLAYMRVHEDYDMTLEVNHGERKVVN